MLGKTQHIKPAVIAMVLVPILILCLKYICFMMKQQVSFTYEAIPSICMTIFYNVVVGLALAILIYTFITAPNNRLINFISLGWIGVVILLTLLWLFFQREVPFSERWLIITYYTFYGDVAQWLSGCYLFILCYNFYSSIKQMKHSTSDQTEE